jgi:hypothetical protein
VSELHKRRYKIWELKSQLKKIIFAKRLSEKLHQGWEIRQSEYESAVNLLKEYGVDTIDDLPNILWKLHDIPYSYSDVQKAISLLKW